MCQQRLGPEKHNRLKIILSYLTSLIDPSREVDIFSRADFLAQDFDKIQKTVHEIVQKQMERNKVLLQPQSFSTTQEVVHQSTSP